MPFSFELLFFVIQSLFFFLGGDFLFDHGFVVGVALSGVFMTP